MAKTLALALVAALTLSACTGGTASTTAVTYDQVAVTDAAVAAAEGDVKFAGAGILMALDRGYAFEDIVEAIDADLFEPFYGYVWDAKTDSPATPTGPDTGIIADKGEILADGTIVGWGPSPAGGFGFSRAHASAVRGDVLLASLLDSIGSTFGGLNFGATTVEELIARPGKPDLPPTWQDLTDDDILNRSAVIAIVGLASSGYSVEQIVWVIIGGTRVKCLPFGDVDGMPCHVPGEKPELAPVKVFGDADAAPAASDSETTAAPDEAKPSASFLGTASITLHDFPGETTLSNASFIVGPEFMSGWVEQGLETEIYREGSRNIGCQYLLIEFLNMPLVDAATHTYSGTMHVYRPATEYDTLCGVAFAGSDGYNYEGEATFTLDGDTLSGTADGVDWTFEATRESADA